MPGDRQLFVSQPDHRTVLSYQAVFFDINAIVDTDAPAARAFPDAQALLRALLERGIVTGVVTCARDGADLLASAGMADLFTVCCDGNEADHLGLRGQSEMLLETCRRVEVDPRDAAVVTGTAIGVQDAVSCGFNFVVGLCRTGSTSQLAAAGADRVVGDLTGGVFWPPSDPHSERVSIDRRELSPSWGGHASAAVPHRWLLVYDHFRPDQETSREALCALGNGYWATRGAVPGTVADDVHYPGTYLAGVYNRLGAQLDGQPFETESLVKAPDWTWLTVQPTNGPVLQAGTPEMLEHHQVLDLRHGVLTRDNRYRDAAGRTTRVRTRQLQSMADPHLAALEVTVVAEDWSGELLIRSRINGKVANTNAVADRPLPGEHLLSALAEELDAQTVLYEAVTSQSQIRIATAARTRAHCAGTSAASPAFEAGMPGHDLRITVEPGDAVVIEKTAAIATSRDRAISTPVLDAAARIRAAPDFPGLLTEHEKAWTLLWDRFGISLDSGSRQELALNFHTFHVLQTITAASPALDAGVPARGLHGEAYRGHIFWDELFVYPLLTLRRPNLTRACLMYRHRRLPAARRAARTVGLDGAMFPWRSGSEGREETPSRLFNVRNGMWMPDNSHRQRHIGLAVAYCVWRYYQATADIGFLETCGAELIIEVARFFSSLATYDESADRFDISGVMGPDEYHDGYPETPGQGLRNNAYTNVLTAWVLTKAIDTVELLSGRDCDPLWQRLGLNRDELARWGRVSRGLRIVFHADGIISQFEGYEGLQEFDWPEYRRRYGNIERLDLILQAEGDSTNRYKLSKQADVLMLFYLFSAEEVRDVFLRLGYELPPAVIPRTVDYYLARTSHGSTLSRVVHAWVAARTDRAGSWSLFHEALEADLADTQGGSTREGIHLGAMAGTADMAIRCYGGVETREDALWLHPVLPDELASASFELSYRGQPITVEMTSGRMRIQLHSGSAPPIQIHAEGITRTLNPGQRWDVTLSLRTPDRKNRRTLRTSAKGAEWEEPEPRQ